MRFAMIAALLAAAAVYLTPLDAEAHGRRGIRVAVAAAPGAFVDVQTQRAGLFGLRQRTSIRVGGFAAPVGFNGFPSRTIVDFSGNVYEVDPFGRAAFRGNRFGFRQQSFGFSSGPVFIGGGCR